MSQEADAACPAAPRTHAPMCAPAACLPACLPAWPACVQASTPGGQNVNVQPLTELPAQCPDGSASSFGYGADGDCLTSSVTALVGVDEAWYDCGASTTTIWLWVVVSANSKVGVHHWHLDWHLDY